MIRFNPMRVPGRWRDGYALDNHTVSSVFIGHDEYGHAQFSTTRSEAGELLYTLKYKADPSAVAGLTEAAAAFLATWRPPVQLIVPIPPSRPRTVQPVPLLAQAIAQAAGIGLGHDVITRSREVPELKNVHDYSERTRLLADAHTVDCAQVRGRSILLFDDLFRSGATMNAVAAHLLDDCQAASVYALTITRTRSNA